MHVFIDIIVFQLIVLEPNYICFYQRYQKKKKEKKEKRIVYNDSKIVRMVGWMCLGPKR